MLNNKSIIKYGFYSYLFLLAFLSLFIGGTNAEENIIHKLSLTDSGFFLHVAAYFVASVLGVLVMAEKGLTKIIFILVAIFFYGYFLEIVQYFHPYRTFNINDVLANGVGIVIYFLIFFYIKA
ncbi:VanZ family protein [candidate division KSB1 bacterium]|nr:VanZ family protein [candidate division KSB1 bacterium]